MDDEAVRFELAKLIGERRDDFATLSRLLGRNPAYIQQYLKRKSPRRLAEADRARLARWFNVGEDRLGGPRPDQGRIAVRRFDIGASAGHGAFADGEAAAAPIAFDPKRLKEIASAPPSALSIIRVSGDSMEPSLSDGDEIMVDTSDAQARLRAGIYVIRLDGALAVKRLAPGADGIAVLSDNPAFSTIPDCAPERLSLIGRVVWAGRRMR